MRPTATPPAKQPTDNRSTRLSDGARVQFASLGSSITPQPAVAVARELAAEDPAPKEPIPEPTVTTQPPAASIPPKPEVAEPVPAEPVPAEPVAAEPVPAEPVPAEPVLEDLVPEPVIPVEPEPASLVPSIPTLTDSGSAAIVVTVTSGGLMIASEDTEALDRFEDMLTMLTGGATGGGGPEMTVFYLKYTKAMVVAETLDQLLGGGTLATQSGGGSSLLGDLAGAALGESGGGMMGALLGLGGGGGSTSYSPSGSIRITPDTRLNALLVQAGATDVDMIYQLLEILDQKESPEDVVSVAKAKIIPVYNVQAEVIAENIQQLYKDRMVTGAGSSGGAQRPSPEQFIQMLRGGGRGKSGSSRSQADEVQKMSITVDTTTNSVLVAAPEPLLTQIEDLVRQLDTKALESNSSTVRVVKLHGVGSDTMQRSLSGIMGDSVQFNSSSPSSSSRSRTSSRPSSGGGDPGSDARRAAFIEMMRARMQGGGGGPGMMMRPGGGPPGSGRGGPPGGSRGGPPGGSRGGR